MSDEVPHQTPEYPLFSREAEAAKSGKCSTDSTSPREIHGPGSSAAGHGWLLRRHERRASGTCAAHRLELALLEDAKQLGLKFERHVASFIEKQCATMRARKAADVRGDRTRERSPFVPEKLAFEKAGGHRRTI